MPGTIRCELVCLLQMIRCMTELVVLIELYFCACQSPSIRDTAEPISRFHLSQTIIVFCCVAFAAPQFIIVPNL